MLQKSGLIVIFSRWQFNCHPRTNLVDQYGRCFLLLKNQHGLYDVMKKTLYSSRQKRYVFQENSDLFLDQLSFHTSPIPLIVSRCLLKGPAIMITPRFNIMQSLPFGLLSARQRVIPNNMTNRNLTLIVPANQQHVHQLFQERQGNGDRENKILSSLHFPRGFAAHLSLPI